MIKKLLFIFLLSFVVHCSYGSNALNPTSVDSLEKKIAAAGEDTNKLALTRDLWWKLIESAPDQALKYSFDGLRLAKKLDNEKYRITFTNYIGFSSEREGNYAEALKNHLQALEWSEDKRDTDLINQSLNGIGLAYGDENDTTKSLEAFRRIVAICARRKDPGRLAITYGNMGGVFVTEKNKSDSALYYFQKAYEIHLTVKDSLHLANDLVGLGYLKMKQNDNKQALEYCRASFNYSIPLNDLLAQADAYGQMAQIYNNEGQTDSAIFYARKTLMVARQSSNIYSIPATGKLLSDLYKGLGKYDSAYKYQSVAAAANDSLTSREKTKEMQRLSFNEELRQQEIAQEKLVQAEERRKNLQLFAIAIFIVSFFVAVLLLSSRKIHPRLIEFLGLLALLLFFEFLSMLIDPALIRLTHDSPVWMLLILVAIASVLEPLYNYLEHKMKHHLLRKQGHEAIAPDKKPVSKNDSVD